jgi:hypothetical protein
MKEGVITGTSFSLETNDMKDLEDLLRVEEPDEGFLGALLRDGENGLCQWTLIRIEEANHFGEGLEGSESLIASSGQIAALGLEIIKESEDELGGDLLQPEGFDFDAVVICGKEEKKFESVTIGFEGMVTHAPDVRKVVVEELVDGGRELHSLPFCQREKS